MTSSRAYETAGDLRLMQALTAACWLADWPAPHFHPGDLDWWASLATGDPAPVSERARLWFAGEPDASDLVAWGWFGPPGDLDLTIRPDLRGIELVREIVAWGEERARTLSGASPLAGVSGGEPGILQAFAGDAQAGVVEALLGLGFERREEGWFAQFTRRFDVEPLPGPVLPPGFLVRTIASDGDVAARIACGRAAFGHSRMTTEKYEAVRRSTLYRSTLDRITIAPDGSVVALALGWLDPVSLALELEPVAVHPAYHRRGLGRAICLATVAAGRALGATHGSIAAEGNNPAALALYTSLGYEITRSARPYRRPLRV